ncbi:protein kinase STUNTED-like isoform X2 [Andrographis paniculata]|uniref:protein kinase STUNTED-like isoform X2 n=1 Tax=Andrographis paniculata TaxID=175694 RepID=UPI0021E8E5CB|nr:protein kinase STUNTED-like isoform X2 [Andrographis paniculata]
MPHRTRSRIRRRRFCSPSTMRLVADGGEKVECGAGDAPERGGGVAVVVVGVRLDSRSKELLTWALVKVARSGDHVIALHVLNPEADKSSMASLVKTFDSLLAAYEGFCNLKQVDLKLKICQGSPVRKILFLEAKLCGATSVVVGISEGSPASIEPEYGTLDASKPNKKKRRTLSISSLPPERVISSFSNEGKSMSLMNSEPVKTRDMPKYRSRWTLLRRVLLHGGRVLDSSSTKKSSTVQWLFQSQNQPSMGTVCSDPKQISASNGDDCLELDDEKRAVVQHSADTIVDSYPKKIIQEELKELVNKYTVACQLFSYQELLLATNNFSLENMIGRGGSSQVYKGHQLGGKEIAVKVLKPSVDVLNHFISEIELITTLHHKNIISLVGFCFDEDQLLLVYNLLSRGCLEQNLYESGTLLGWHERYKVALGVAEALEYLHDAAKPIIHRDVKSSNILLADDFEPKLSDFGLATWASSCSHHLDTSDVAGTFGYLAPEYFMHGKLNEKIDVYAFGVVLLELLSGRKPIDNGHPKGQESLVMWARSILKEGKLSELRDPSLANNAYDGDQFERMVLAATLCIRHASQSRPVISTVTKLLQGDPEIIEWARQESNACEDKINGDIQSFINVALLDLEDDATSVSSSEQNVLVEDYLRGRWSRSSSFD